MDKFKSALILAGGQSTRMGFDKQTLQKQGQRLMDHLVAQLATRFDDIMIASPTPELYDSGKVRVIQDVYQGIGPLGGIHAALLVAKSEAVFTIACDMPFLELSYIDYMIAQMAQGDYDACLTWRGEHLETFHGFYCRSSLVVLEEELAHGRYSVNHFARKINSLMISEEKAASFSPGWRAFTNLNTPKEYEAFLKGDYGEILDRKTCAQYGVGDLARELEILRIEDGASRTVQDCVVVEHSLALDVNGKNFTDFLCTPSDLEALVYGHLFAQGMIQRTSDLQSFTLQDNVARVMLRDIEDRERMCCSSLELVLQAHELFEAVKTFDAQSPLFATTGGVHSAALCQSDGRKIFMEDVGRHNAVDKVFGKALIEDWEIGQTYLITSGRVSEGLVVKAIYTGLSIIISRSAPTDKAVELAKRSNITLCGFARGRRVNVYSGRERVFGF